MPRKISIIIGSMLGALLIYCGQTTLDQALDGSAGDGTRVGDGTRKDGRFIRDAHAAGAECCTPSAQTLKPLGQVTLDNNKHLSGSISVSAYREVIVYRISGKLAYTCTGSVWGVAPEVTFRADANSPFGDTGAGSNGRIRVDGSDLQIRISNPSDCASGQFVGSVTYLVAGVQ
jgi:hypothetical protein